MSKTVQGVCADCWGSKGGRQFWLRKGGLQSSSARFVLGLDPLSIGFLVCYALAALLVGGLLLWIWG
jgi:hypothetical protein